MKIKDKIISSLIYGSIGDAYGAYCEGTDGKMTFNIEDVNTPYITDDTELTLATCEAIIENNSIDPEKIAEKFVEWFNAKKITGIGSSTLKALQELSAGHHWTLTGRKGEKAAGNGAAMRIAPISFLIDINDELNKITVKDICRITHHNDEAYLGALCLIYIHQLLIHNNGKKIDYFKYLIDKFPDSNIRDRLINISNERNLTIFEIGKKYGSSGYVVDTVTLAIYIMTKFEELNFIKF